MKHHRGYAAALMLSVLGGAAVGNVGESADGAQWLCCLAGGAAGAAGALLLTLFRRKSGEKDFFAALCGALGNGPGKLLAAGMGAVCLRLCAHDLAGAGEFLSANLLEETPYLFIAGVLAAAAGFAAVKGERALSGWAEVMLPPVAGLFLLGILLALPDLRPEELAASLSAVTLQGGADAALDFFLLPCCGSLGCGLLLFRGGEKGSGWGAAGILGAALLLALLYGANTALLGAKLLSNFNFPTYHALRVIGLSSLRLRLEALLMLPLVMVSFLRMAVLLLAARRGFETAFCRKEAAGGKLLPWVLAGAALLLSRVCYLNQTSLIESERLLRFLALVPLLTVAAGAIGTALRRRNAQNG